MFQFSPPHCKEMLCAPLRHQSWAACFGVINQVVTWVELCGYPAPDVPLISAWSPVHQGIVITGKTSPTKNLIPFITTSPPSLFLPHNPHLSLPPRFVPQACAPLYSWRTGKDIPHSDATGTCYLSVHNFTKFVEYAPCRTGNCHLSLKEKLIISCVKYFMMQFSTPVCCRV